MKVCLLLALHVSSLTRFSWMSATSTSNLELAMPIVIQNVYVGIGGGGGGGLMIILFSWLQKWFTADVFV